MLSGDLSRSPHMLPLPPPLLSIAPNPTTPFFNAPLFDEGFVLVEHGSSGMIAMATMTHSRQLGSVDLAKGFKKSYYNRYRGGVNLVSDGYNKGTTLGDEIIVTFIIVYIVFSATNPKKSARDSHDPVLTLLLIGFAIFMVHLARVPVINTNINLTRSFGQTIIFNNDIVR
ncbi:hypothetical protein VNO78_20342 [Psophocarpus tetragonolobus]|uniref:Uncharacterized protein n=1 Tax=Psophocarpus tetragonolobus TaxID=3891 RepID=A0AAN9S938_PSOTE